MNNTEYKEALDEIAEQDRGEQEKFDVANNAYITRDESDRPFREQNAARLDTTLAEFPSLMTDESFDFVTPSWNDELDEMQLYQRCDEITATLRRRGAETLPPRDTITSIDILLNNSFSERIKTHIVTLVTGQETIEGACRHCFDLYQDDSHLVGLPMAFWFSLSRLLGTAPVFNAFLDRAWHLSPTSSYFPRQYQDLVSAIRASNLDKQERGNAHYANPYAQLQALNDTFKELQYAMKHTSDPSEKSKLANAQVKVLGAMFVINERQEKKHQESITKAQQHALNPSP